METSILVQYWTRTLQLVTVKQLNNGFKVNIYLKVQRLEFSDI